jgi:hypothetical protein
MERALRGWMFGCALAVFGSASTIAFAKEIPFFATNNSNLAFCLVVNGPWARESGFPNLAAPSPGTNRWNFYTAEGTLFSPLGSWTFEYFKGHYDGNDCVPDTFENNISGSINFCLRPIHTEIDLTINPDYSAIVNAPTPPCPDSLTTTGDLGDQGGGGRAPAAGLGATDRDTFGFEGKAGEALTINLVADGAAGHIGKLAGLQLLFGSTVVAETDGPVPLALDATLPAAGKYQVVVLEKSDRAGQGFRGRYVLSVVPDTGSDDRLLEPQPDAEHF